MSSVLDATPSATTSTGAAGDPVEDAVLAVCRAARAASRSLATATRARKDAALLAVADALVAQSARVVEANGRDLERGAAEGLAENLLDRLRLDVDRLRDIAGAVRDVAGLPDPVGEVVRGQTLPNGLRLRQLRVPMGVVAVVYEARPNVTVDAAALALKSGSAVVLRGGSAARETNAVVVAVVREALVAQGLPAELVSTVDEHGRPGVQALMRARGLVDVLVPRGGAGLIAEVVRSSTVPVIETGTGNCHVYVDAAADLASALEIALNSKTQRTSVCNSAETVLVHAAVADAFLPPLLGAMAAAGVRLHGDDAVRAAAEHLPGVQVEPATDADWAAEYLAMELAVGVVPDLDAALAHIDRWSTGHTEAVVTRDLATAERFAAEVDSAAVMVNASTRFTDGAQMGLGAEIGISTQKLHARGPMGLAELTTTRWVVTGDGHVRP
ncbi:glutamate-5-semialdehyde dehydrogenase [uncultured Pseudokineococcus sp.]|uniref:glutamate-5-semialdehyde dehydrogenase n=1 Tax=uncultured Pseudokineococcus sp. TaxID=1642928 RepID=UPI00260FED28|nr:glutamate-5-semialdehyde dehydrogenase [uncultured Pseudokineococcus sp.]